LPEAIAGASGVAISWPYMLAGTRTGSVVGRLGATTWETRVSRYVEHTKMARLGIFFRRMLYADLVGMDQVPHTPRRVVWTGLTFRFNFFIFPFLFCFFFLCFLKAKMFSNPKFQN
jgi:hypothetical protein